VHIAIQQGELAAQHALGRSQAAICYDNFLSVVFTDPQIAHIGLQEAELKARGIQFHSASYPFNDHGKSILMLATDGYVKLWAEAGSGKLLAAEGVSKDASELIHALSVGISLGASCKDLLRAQWYHPTLSEIWTYPLEELSERCC
jgi:pyruvate/2-oxoglutarate dehydrogenase complex dihydrolipoamide dehydrogenase (E3) component